jgi:alpha-ketoglutarate-dependent taurine dioxygenase
MLKSEVRAGLTIKPLEGADFGAEVIGLVPREIKDAQRKAIWELYRERHGLLCFSFGRLLESDELHALTAVFGKNEFGPGRINGIGKKPEAGEETLTVEEQVAALKAKGIDPYMAYIGNLEHKTLKRKPVEKMFFGEWEWHTDMSYIEVPPTFSLLHARIIPEEGGDTGFCSQVMAAKALPTELRQQIYQLTAKHDSTYGSSGKIRPGMTPPSSPIEALGYVHPILRKLPTTGEEALFLGRRTNGYIVGLPLKESEALLDRLWKHSTQPEFCYRHMWKIGQVVAWDNRMMLHMRHPVDESLDRFMWRTQTKGEAVIPVS